MKAVKGAGWLVFSRFLGRMIDFFTLLILARVLTPTDFGMTALAMSLVVIVDTVLEVPVTQALLRLAHVQNAHLDTGFTLGILRSSAIALLVAFAAWPLSKLYNDPHLVPLLLVLAIGPIARGLYSPNMTSFTRDLHFKQTFISEISGKLLAFGVAITIALSGGGYWAIVANYIVSAVSNTIGSYILAPYRPALSLAKFSDFSSFIGWFSGSQIVAAINWQLDRIILGRFVDRAVLGRYALATDMATLPSQSLIGPALQPLMVAFTKINSDPQRLRAAFLKTSRLAILVSAPIFVGISLTADLVISVLLGPKWHDAAPILQIVAPTMLAAPYFQTIYAYSLATDRPSIIFRLNAIECVMRISFVTAGIYFFSIDGAIAARAIVAAAMLVFYLNCTRRFVGIDIITQLANLWKPVAATAVMAAFVVLFREEVAGLGFGPIVVLAASAVVGAASYLAVLYASGLHISADWHRLELRDRWL